MNRDDQECLNPSYAHLKSDYERRLVELNARQDSSALRLEQERAALDDAVRREEHAAEVRRKVRELCEPLLDPQRNGGLPIIEVLEGALNWVAGSLDSQELDESAGLKVRRLGRLMATEAVLF